MSQAIYALRRLRKIHLFKQLYAKFHMPSKLRPSHEKLPGGVGTGGRAEGVHAPPFFDRSVTLISQGEGYALHIITRPPLKFSHLPTSLFALLWVNILTLGTENFLFGRMG